MEEDDFDDPPPFWLHPSSSPSSSALRRRGSTSYSSPLLLLLAILVVAASLVLVFLVLPYFRSSLAKTPQLPNPKPSPQPHSIKKGWDSLNLVLVLFAVICSFLGRTGGGGGNDNAGSASRTSSMKSTVTPRTPYRSYHYYYDGGGGFSEENRYGGYLRSSPFNGTLTRRNSFSYPDLRLESAWSSSDLDRQRFYDDTSIDRRGFVDGEQIYGRSGSRRWSNDIKVEEVKKVVEDATARVSPTEGELVKYVEPPQPQPQPESPLPLPSPPSPPPLPAVKSRRKHRRRMSYDEGIPRSWMDDDFVDEVPERPLSNPPSPPPPPPPPAPVVHRRGSSEEKISNRNGKKRGSSGSATKEFFQSLGRKKKQRNKSIENFEALLGHPSSLDRHRLTLSPPPSPPSSHSVLQNLFSSNKSRNRNRKTAPHSSPLPSHPPRRTSDVSKSKRPKNPEQQPSYNIIIEQGNRSPLIPIPPAPPPPPPFRVPEWKFVVVDRDHVRIKSREPSRINSPDITDCEDDQGSVVSNGSLSLTSSPTSIGTMELNVKGEENAMMFCPSPDVDMKADKFIARFREGLKLEKMNSWNQRQGTPNVRSNLGPSRDQS